MRYLTLKSFFDFWLISFWLFINLYASFSTFFPIIFNSIFSFLICIYHKNVKVMNKYQTNLLLISLCILLISLISAFANSLYSSYSLSRCIRISVYIVVLSITINNYLAAIKISLFFNAVVFVLLLNVFCVYLQMIFPEIKPLFYSFFYTEKVLKELPLRAFGLSSSFDGTGLCICLLLLLLLLKFRLTFKLSIGALFLISYFSIFFVSRFSMIVGSLLFLIFIYYIARYRIKLFVFILFPILLFVGYSLVKIVMESLNSKEIRIEESYGNSQEALLNDMILFPNNIWQNVIGTGDTIETSDIGYIKIVYMIGFSGLILIMCFYFYSLYEIKNKKIFSSDTRLLFQYTLGVLILILLFNYKLLFLYARAFSDFYLILVLLLYSKTLSVYEKN